MKYTHKITLAILTIIVFAACQKNFYLDENLDMKNLLEYYEWQQTEATVVIVNEEFTDTYKYYKNIFKDECYENYSYSFNFSNELFTVKDCNGDIAFTENTLELFYLEDEEYKWQIDFDTTFWCPELAPISTSYINKDEKWKFEFISEDKFRISKELLFTNTSYLSTKITRTFKAIE